MDDTFTLSNMSPQVGKGFNRDKWNEVELYTRTRAMNARSVCVVTGPLYVPETSPDGKRYVRYEVIGGSDVAVPTHFFKVAKCRARRFPIVEKIV